MGAWGFGLSGRKYTNSAYVHPEYRSRRDGAIHDGDELEECVY